MTREEARKLTKQILSYAAVPEASVRLSVERRGFCAPRLFSRLYRRTNPLSG